MLECFVLGIPKHSIKNWCSENRHPVWYQLICLKLFCYGKYPKRVIKRAKCGGKKCHSIAIFDIETMRYNSHACHSAFQRMKSYYHDIHRTCKHSNFSWLPEMLGTDQFRHSFGFHSARCKNAMNFVIELQNLNSILMKSPLCHHLQHHQ